MGSNNINILIVDDHPPLREGVVSIIKNSELNTTLFEACDGEDAMEHFQKQTIDIALVDISMPNTDGLKLTEEIIKTWGTKVIIVSAFDNVEYVRRAASYGVRGYILKGEEREYLIQAIENVMAGSREFSRNISDKFYDSVQVQGNTIGIKITRRESEILYLLAEGYTTDEIGKRLFISTSTIETHRKNLISKFEVRNSIALVAKAIKLGFIVVDRLFIYRPMKTRL